MYVQKNRDIFNFSISQNFLPSAAQICEVENKYLNQRVAQKRVEERKVENLPPKILAQLFEKMNF